MKLVELYIENFGGLSRYAVSFEDGLTTVLEPNGFGKTTLAEFIRAMFYGFPRRSKTLDKSKRQRYAPWNGGSFGGNLVFRQDGQCYRIERTFGAVPKEDTLAVYDLATGRKTSRFGEEPGLVLFGLDADSFERSTYLPQAGVEGPLATASILSKLTDLVEDSTDVASYDKAVAALKAKRSALIPYRGSGGSVAERAAEITRLQLRLDTAAAQEAQLKAAQEETVQAQAELDDLNDQLTQVAEKLRASASHAAAAQQRQQHAQLLRRLREAQEQIARCHHKYSGDTLREETLRRAEVAAERLQQCEKNAAAQYHTAADSETVPVLPGRVSKVPAAGMIVGAVCAVAGAVMMLALELPYGFAAAAAGMLLLFAGIVAASVQKRKRQEAEKKYSAVMMEQQRQALRRAQLKAEKDAASNELQALFEEIGLPFSMDHAATLAQAWEDLRAMQRAQALVQVLTEQLQLLETGTGDSAHDQFAEDPQRLYKQEQQLRADITAVTKQLLRLQQSVRLLQEAVSVIPALREKLEDSRRKLTEEREKAELLDATLAFLQESRENLATAYLGTIRSRFGQYLSMLGSGEGKILVDSDLQIQLERRGQARELAYFSAGQTDLVMLCMRMALVDALFKDHETIVILDDPFVNLDDAHMQKARSMLRALAQNRQILYLTCHTGRMV